MTLCSYFSGCSFFIRLEPTLQRRKIGQKMMTDQKAVFTSLDKLVAEIQKIMEWVGLEGA